MRRFLLIITVISFAGWSQPAQQQAQPPIFVQIQTPRESIWAALLKLVIPTLLGAALGSGITLYGLDKNNKHNAAENRANRQHDLEKLNREHSFTLKRDVLMRVTQSLVQTLAALQSFQSARQTAEMYDLMGEKDDLEQALQKQPCMDRIRIQAKRIGSSDSIGMFGRVR